MTPITTTTRRYIIPDRPDLPVYNYSSLKHYQACPLKFHYTATLPSNESARKTAVVYGNILERMVLGDFDGALGLKELADGSFEITKKGRGTMVGSITKATLDSLWSTALAVRSEIFGSTILEYVFGPGVTGSKQHKLSAVIDDQVRERLGLAPGPEYGLAGAIDYAGPGMGNGRFLDAILGDLKNTKKISTSPWETSPDDPMKFFQAALYALLWYLNYDEVRPFVYWVVEDLDISNSLTDMSRHKLTPVIRTYEVHAEESYWSWIIDYVDKVHNDRELSPTPSYPSCVKNREQGTGSCEFLPICNIGRAFVANSKTLTFNELQFVA